MQWEHGATFEPYETDGEPWFGFDCVRDLKGLPPELLIIPVVGHSRGHAAIAVEANDGWLLHAGDAYFHSDQMNVERPSCPPGIKGFQSAVAFHRPTFWSNVKRLRHLVRDHGDEVRVFSAHDPTELAALQT